MIGTTRSRVSLFMNRFRKLGFIEYNGEIRVHDPLLNIFLQELRALRFAEPRFPLSSSAQKSRRPRQVRAACLSARQAWL
jgi:CRP/FNR family transcriptional regulator, cyclic AMP receptor protein